MNVRIGKIASKEYRMDELFQNCQFLEPHLVFQIEKIEKVVNYSIWEIPKNFN